ncbi:class I SAM-dependent methyltransferase [uncultured Desulfovibrio sp.]|uniref:tRNA (mnm(5)s(2)U34)-methyltransferase n=1 Tax=uncultured Desulfovibrio sp. TaxID=167968 RepID=UPI0026315D7D|nr:class I SAM-dependent methyltransferase [uncultured Desulfovibrio sp.]
MCLPGPSEASLRPTRASLLDSLVHAALRRALAAAAAPLLLDATLGNGHDCAFLLRCAPDHSLLLGLDVQPQALDAARARLAGISRPDVRVQFFCQGHEHLARLWETLPREDRQRPLMAAVFNLGWLPGGDKTCLTQAATTVAALDALVPRLAPQGCISLHCYTGNTGGAEEEAAILERVAALPPRHWRVLHCRDANRLPGPGRAESLILLERLPVSAKRG